VKINKLPAVPSSLMQSFCLLQNLHRKLCSSMMEIHRSTPYWKVPGEFSGKSAWPVHTVSQKTYHLYNLQ